MALSVNTALLALLTCASLVSCRLGEPLLELDPEVYCRGRSAEEFFRKQLPPETTEQEARQNCRTFYRCVPASGGGYAISSLKCQDGMMFDVVKQICEVSRNVDNCILSEKEKPPLPRWPLKNGEESSCPTGNQIECGTGECVEKQFFCDAVEDCKDGSDENVCGSPELDPNAAPRCDPRTCRWDDKCFCSVDGTRIPKEFTPSQTPQMITVTFTGAVNERNFRIFDRIFTPTTKNKGNDCTSKATFFVSHAFTNYSAVQELHRRGHEIATNSITNNGDPKYWTKLSYDGYEAEFDGCRQIIARFANISDYDIVGTRVPLSRVGGNSQFQMMSDWGFFYDSSMSAPMGRLPLWPYFLIHRMPHKCLGIDQKCPTRNFTIWEMVLNELDRRDNPEYDEPITGCHYVDQCANLISRDQFRRFLDNNLARHYNTNRAPLGLHFTAAFFETHSDFLPTFVNWVADTAAKGDYYFVTMQEVILWMENPTETAAINNFPEWKKKCDPKGLPYCSLPNPCPSNVPRLFPREESMFLNTCEECPDTYPWLGNPNGFAIDL